MWPWSVACSHRQKLLYTCQSPRSLAAASTIFSRYKTLMSANIQDSCIRITADKGSPRPWFSKAHIDISDDNSEVMQCGASSCLNVATRTRPRNPTNSISHSALTMSYFDQNQALMIVNFELLSLYPSRPSRVKKYFGCSKTLRLEGMEWRLDQNTRPMNDGLSMFSSGR